MKESGEVCGVWQSFAAQDVAAGTAGEQVTKSSLLRSLTQLPQGRFPAVGVNPPHSVE
jgi:hypothetical protein